MKLNKITTSRTSFTIDDPDKHKSWHYFITVCMTRPTRLFFTEPIVFLVTVMASIAFGQIYLLTEALPAIYKQAPFSFDDKQASLAFIPIALGLILNIIPRFYDHYLLARIKRQGKITKPEDKIHGFALGAPILAIGLWCFAWSIPPLIPTPWPVSFLPLILIGFATNEFDCTLAGYLTDSYTIYSASAYASMAFMRAIVSGCLPLLADKMYASLGANIATTILAAQATAFCGIAILFLTNGENMRERSEFAKWSREAEKRMGGIGSRPSADGSRETRLGV